MLREKSKDMEEDKLPLGMRSRRMLKMLSLPTQSLLPLPVLLLSLCKIDKHMYTGAKIPSYGNLST